MSFIRALLLGGLFMLFGFSATGAQVAGIKIEDVIKVDGTELVLNGAGVRSKFFIKVYVAALHVPQKSTSVETLLKVSSLRRMSLRMLRSMDAQTLSEALEEGLRNNLSVPEMSALRPALDELMAIMKRLEKISEGDAIALDLTPQMVTVSLNSKGVGSVSSTTLANALLRVWLGDHPVDASLKAALLGG